MPTAIHRYPAALAALAIVGSVLVGCSRDESTTPEQARQIIVSGLVERSGMSPELAGCVADRALATHDVDELVNSEGATSDEVNASIAAIADECRAELAPATTVPVSTMPPTTTTTTTVPPTTVAVDLGAFCESSYEVAVAIRAADVMQQPGPLALEAYFREAVDRAHQAVLAAPTAEYQADPLTLVDLFEQFRSILQGVGYVVDDVSDTDQAQLKDAATQVKDIGARLEQFLDAQCDPAGDVQADATELADRFLALDTPTDTTPTTPTDYIPVDDPDVGIEVSVPSSWTQQASDHPLDPPIRVLIVTNDLLTFDGEGVNGDGVKIVGYDNTTDYAILLDGTDPATSCQLDAEDPYDDGVYVGRIQYYSNCGGTSTQVVVVAAADAAGNESAYIEIRLTQANDDIVDEILTTFYV